MLENIKTINYISLFLVSSIFGEEAEGEAYYPPALAYKHNERNKMTEVLLR